MLLIWIWILVLVEISNCTTQTAITQHSETVAPCVLRILKKYYVHGSTVTYVDINFTQSEEILKAMSLLYHVSIVSRTTARKQLLRSDEYVVAAGSPQEFLDQFRTLQREPEWHPDRKLLIVTDNLKFEDLRSMFQTLLHLSVANATIISNDNDPIVYTYDPFENYGCGQRFDRIIEKGKCSGTLEDVFFYKYSTGLKNCTFKASIAHWPPFTINQAIDKGPRGVEEFIVDIFGEREHFKTFHYNYSDDGEDFSLISENMSAIGPLMLVQEKKDHLMFGGMLLTNSRARVFDYIWVHLAYMDDVRVLVKSATSVEAWRNSYLGFSFNVWLSLVIVLIVYYLIILLVFRPKDKIRMFIKMGDYFFQHGSSISGRLHVKFVFIFWIWFSYLISSLYTSSLVGLITNPIMGYQVSNRDDLTKYGLQSCVSPVIMNYFYSVNDNSFLYDDQDNITCGSLLRSIDSVSRSDDLYTISLFSIYSYHKYKFYDKWGRSRIHPFKLPMNKVVFAIYLYKGFPMVDRLQMLALELKENGIINHYFDEVMNEQRKKFTFHKKPKEFHILVPWYLLIAGSCVSTIVFIVEINRKPLSKY